MSDAFPQLILASLLLGGCGQATSEPARTFVWDTQDRPYEVLGVGESNVPSIGEQARMAQVVYPRPDDRKAIETAVNEIYGELKQDVEDAQPDAKYRRIVVSVFDAKQDIEHDPRAWVCWLTLAPEPGEALPEQATNFIEWQWHDPQARPTDEEREMEWEYLAGMEHVNLGVQFPITDGELTGLAAMERRQYMEDRYPDFADDLKQKIAQKNGMSEAAFQELLDRILQWKYQEESVAQVSSSNEPIEPVPADANDSEGQ